MLAFLGRLLPRGRLLSLLAFLLPFAVFLIGLRYVGSGDTEPAELLPISLLREGNFDFNEFVHPGEALPYWFRKVGSRVVSNYPIFPGLVNLPVYFFAHLLGANLLAQRYVLSLISASLISALSVMFMYFVLEHVCESRFHSILFALIYAFATCVWSVAARGMWQHGPSILLFSIVLLFLLKDQTPYISWSGFFLCLAVVNRPSNMVIAVPLALYVMLHRRKAFAGFMALALIPVILNAWYGAAYLGSPFAMGYWNPFPEVANFRGNMAVGLAGLLISPSRGLFVFSPIFLPAPLGAVTMTRRVRSAPLYAYLGVGAVLLILLFSRWSTWWAGHTFGYRYLIELTPGLVLFLAIAWRTCICHHRALRLAFFACLTWSVYVNFLGAAVHPSGFNQKLDEDPAVLWSVKESEIVLSSKKLLLQLGFR